MNITKIYTCWYAQCRVSYLLLVQIVSNWLKLNSLKYSWKDCHLWQQYWIYYQVARKSVFDVACVKHSLLISPLQLVDSNYFGTDCIISWNWKHSTYIFDKFSLFPVFSWDTFDKWWNISPCTCRGSQHHISYISHSSCSSITISLSWFSPFTFPGIHLICLTDIARSVCFSSPDTSVTLQILTPKLFSYLCSYKCFLFFIFLCFYLPFSFIFVHLPLLFSFLSPVFSFLFSLTVALFFHLFSLSVPTGCIRSINAPLGVRHSHSSQKGKKTQSTYFLITFWTQNTLLYLNPLFIFLAPSLLPFI